MHADLSTTLAQAGIDADLIDIHRSGFQRVPTDDKPRRRNGAVVVLSDRPLRIWFTNHGTGVQGMYSEAGSHLPSRAEWARMMRMRAEEKARRAASQAEVAAYAEAIWRQLPRADPRHPYLVRKRAQPHGLRQNDDDLVVPVRYAGAITSLQTITPTGEKRFLSGGRIGGCNYGIGIARITLIVCEGFATGATLAETLDLGVACAFSANNLKPVALELQRRYPGSRIIIAGDNDVRTAGNPGLKHAIEAAATVGGRYLVPQFSMKALTEPLSDWNDFFRKYGSGALRAAFEGVRQHVG